MLKHRRNSAPAGDEPRPTSPSGVLKRARELAGKYRDVAMLGLAAPIAVFLVLDYAILPTVVSEHDHAALAQAPVKDELSAAASVLQYILTRIQKRVGGPPLPPPRPAPPFIVPKRNNATLLLDDNFFCPGNVSERRFMLSEGNRSETQTLLIACPSLRRVVFCQLTAGRYAFCPTEFNTSYEQLAQLRAVMRNCRLNCRHASTSYHEDMFERCYLLYHRSSALCLDAKTNVIISLTYDYLQLNEAEVGNLYFVAFYELLG